MNEEQATVDHRLQDILDRLSARGRRITPQRAAILRVLLQGGHPTVDDVHQAIVEEFPTTSLATVYKTVNMLKEEGEILELEFSHMGNRFDVAKPYAHPHVICNRCGAIVDPETLNLEELTEKIRAETGFTISSHRLDFYGLCPKCS